MPFSKEPPKPEGITWSLSVNLGHLLTIGSVIIGMAMGYGHFQSTVSDLASRVIKIEATTNSTELADHAARIAAIERNLEAGRAERLAWQQNVITLLMEMKGQIGALENGNSTRQH